MATKTKTATKARSGRKTSTKPAKGKTSTKPTKGRGKAPKAPTKADVAKVKDGSRSVAKHSDGDLSPSQVRVLRYLKTRKNPATMSEVKDGVGIGAENKYSASWLRGVHELRDYDYIAVEQHPSETTGRAAYHYSIRPDGRKALEKAEKAAKASE